jgi:hypothetical protein
MPWPPRQRPVTTHTKMKASEHIQFLRLRVLNTYSSDAASPVIALSTMAHTYLFNCVEGMQKNCQGSHHILKDADLLLTRTNWDVAGGLPGTIYLKYTDGRIFIDLV